MKQLKFLETKRTPRYSLRKFSVGVASVLLGVTIFGINFTNHSVKAATIESVKTSNSSPETQGMQVTMQQLIILQKLRQPHNLHQKRKVVQVTMQRLIILQKLRQPHNLYQRRKVALTLILDH